MRLAFPSSLLLLFGTLLAHAQISNFKHVIVIVQENRTPDNLFQGLCAPPFGTSGSCSTTPNATQYNIQTSNWLDKHSPTGVTQPLPIPLGNTYDLGHSHGAFNNQCDPRPSGACRMDGAGDVACAGTCPSQPQFRFVANPNAGRNGILDPYLTLATQYGWANYMFQTNQGPSFPAHQFIFGGTSAPNAGDDHVGIFASENMKGVLHANWRAGCIAGANTRVELVQPNPNPPPRGVENSEVYPCFDHQTIPDILPAGVSWRYYTPSAGSIWTAPNAISHICESTGPGGTCQGRDWLNHVDLRPADVLADIRNCNLRSVSWVIPAGQNSDHAGNPDNTGGPAWVAAIVNAIGNHPTCPNGEVYWRNTAIFITWDDWGGWYDHEPPIILPLPQGDYQYGFRVPLIVVSAYTPSGFISNFRYDFGSILRFIEHNFGIPEGQLAFADRRAARDLRGFFHLDQAPRRFQRVSAARDASYFLNDKTVPTDPDDD
ncbi:MAG TPA: alkaline phosphatase family protein [Terriglobales bacterium]|nr:alkaline phosphatase family protein [Terriglobales bacterium]